MRNGIIGIVIGVVIGIVAGATLVVPGLTPEAPTTGERPIVEKTDAEPEAISPAATATERVPPAEGGVRWTMASAYPSTLPQLGTLAKRVDDSIWQISGGTLEVRFHEPDTLVPDLEMFDAVASGTIEAAFATPSFWSARAGALQIFSAVPFGPEAGEYLAWIYFGGGKELYDEIYRRNGVHGIFCGLTAPEASGWFRHEIKTVEDLRGLRMRFIGLGASVMRKLGVKTVALHGGDIFTALEAGTVDAVEFSMPAIDLKLGFHRMAKHYYFPGWHQPATLLDLMINLKKWRSLSPAHRAQLESVCGDNMRYGLAEGEALQFAAMKQLSAAGVRLHRWPPKILAALQAAWHEIVAEESARDPEFKTVWESLAAFRENYAIWRELGYP